MLKKKNNEFYYRIIEFLDSFLTLFKGDVAKVLKLDDIVTAKAKFDNKFTITGQTYSRQQVILIR